MPMPPAPSSSRISSCGKSFASSAGGGGVMRGPEAGSLFVSKPAFSRHFGHVPSGASAGMADRHFGQIRIVLLIIFLPSLSERFSAHGYKEFSRQESAQDREKIVNPLIDLRGAGDRAGDFAAQQFAIALAEAVHRHFYRAFRHAEFLRDFGVRLRFARPRQARLQFVEHRAFAFMNEFTAQFREHAIQQHQRPAALEQFIGAQLVGRFEPIALLGLLFVKRNEMLPAAPFGGPRLVPFVGQEMFETRQQKRTEPAFVRRDFTEVIARQKTREKFLSEVLRVFGTESFPPHVSVKGIPVAAAKIGERPLRTSGVIACRELNDGPMRGRKEIFGPGVPGHAPSLTIKEAEAMASRCAGGYETTRPPLHRSRTEDFAATSR